MKRKAEEIESLNILVVDDSAAMRSIISKTLRLSGLPINELYQAENGAQAIGVIEENWIDLALVDINMPVMDGETFVDRLRENTETADIPVIVISTEASETRISSLRGKGAGFIHKPFAPEELRTAIFSFRGFEEFEHAASITTFGDLDF